MANFSVYLSVNQRNIVLMTRPVNSNSLNPEFMFEDGDLNFHRVYKTDDPDNLRFPILRALEATPKLLQHNSWDLIIIEFDTTPHNPKKIWKISREDKFIYPEGSDRHMFADVRQGLRKFRNVYTAAFIETLTPEVRDTSRRIT